MNSEVVAHNRLGINYHKVPARKYRGPMADVHMHARSVGLTRRFVKAAEAYGITKVWTMAPLEEVDKLREAFPEKFEFIAVPRWQKGGPTEKFISDWQKRLDLFYAKGARLFKIHNAPGTKARWKMDLEHPLMERIISHAYGLGFHFMTHIGDPKGWFAAGKKYADVSVFGSFESQFEQLERLLARFPDRIHMGAHMGGSLEDLPALGRRLEKFPNYIVDSSATKWMVRGVAEQDPAGVRAFFVKYQDRILFGSDNVVNHKSGFDVYASRYWALRTMWETNYNGESPIEDPDAVGGLPRLVGVDLPVEVLGKFYWGNAQRWLGAIYKSGA